MSLLMGILLANLILSLFYAGVKIKQHQGPGMVLFFIFLPVVGFILYFIPIWTHKFLKIIGIDREAVLTHAFEVEKMPEHPDVREALNVVSVEDAVAISDTEEKRALLLNQLKKDINENYKILLMAEQDEDSEMAHYIAATKMEVYRMQQTRWLESRRDYEESPDDPEKFHVLCLALIDMLESQVLSDREQKVYRKRFCDLIQSKRQEDPDVILQRESEEYLCCLIDLERYADAELFWKTNRDRMGSEVSYQEMLKMYYQRGDRKNFEKVFSDLRQRRDIRLSPAGLEQLRYWSVRLADSEGDHARA